MVSTNMVYDRRALAAIAGLITEAQGDRLAQLASGVDSGLTIVEIGSHSGLSTLWLASGSGGAHVFAIDPWGPPRPGSDDDPLGLGDDPYPTFRANLTRLEAWDIITPLRARSLDVAVMWCAPIGLLFIDANHEEEHVRADVAAWAPHIVPGGTIALHDWTPDPGHPYAGVYTVSQELVDTGRWHEHRPVGSLWTATRR